MNKLYHVVKKNLKTNKYKINEAINNERTFDTNSFNLSRGNRNPLPVVTLYLQGGKKNRATTVAGLTCLCNRGYTNSMIKRKHTKYYERNMRSNKVEYSTSTEVYCMAHDVKVPFCMLDFSISNIINHRSYVDNDKVELNIGYGIIIGRDLMIQLGLTASFKRQVLHWDGATVYMK